MHAPSAGEFDGTEFMPGDRVPQRRRNPPLGTAPAPGALHPLSRAQNVFNNRQLIPRVFNWI